MDKAILVIDMPSCCDECFALDEYGDYPVCRITQEQRGYNFRIREQKMDKCPLQPMTFGKWLKAVDTHPELYGWVPLDNVVCSICDGVSKHETSYCPKCGAKMNL